jgi:hypothetical protein
MREPQACDRRPNCVLRRRSFSTAVLKVGDISHVFLPE